MATFIRNKKLVCDNCGKEKEIPADITLKKRTRMMEAFSSKHSMCKPKQKKSDTKETTAYLIVTGKLPNPVHIPQVVKKKKKK